MNVVIYDKNSGKILRRFIGPTAHVAAQISNDNEEFYLNCPNGATAIVNNIPIAEQSTAPTADELMRLIRHNRNNLLADSDWRVLPDSPATTQSKEEWIVYRQLLRDFPLICDPTNPEWPVAPQ